MQHDEVEDVEIDIEIEPWGPDEGRGGRRPCQWVEQAISHAVTDTHERTAPTPRSTVGDEEVAQLAALLRAGRLVLCVGPHLSSRPGFVELLRYLVARLPDEAADEVWPHLDRQPLAAAGFVRRRLGARFADEVRAACERAGEGGASATVHRLAALPFRGVVTTACDPAERRAFAAAERPIPVHHLFERALFSTEDLHAALAGGKFVATAHELYRTRSFLFVGFEPHDLELALLLDRVLAGAPGDREHFAILPDLSPVQAEELRCAFRIGLVEASDADALAQALAVELSRPAFSDLPAADDADGWVARFTDDPSDARVREHLDQLAAELREAGAYEALAELVLGRVAGEPDGEARAELLENLARVFEHEAGDADRALATLFAAWEEAPSRAGWHALERLATAANAWGSLERDFGMLLPRLAAEVRLQLWRKLDRPAELVRALEDRAQEVAPDEQRRLCIEAARLHEERFADHAGAIVRWMRLLAESPRDLEALRALERLYRHEGRTDELRAVLERRAELGGDDAHEALSALHRQAERWPELIDVLVRQAAVAPPARAVELYAEIALLAEEELADFGRAIEAWHLAEDARSSPRAQAALARLYERTGAREAAIAMLDRQAEAASSTAERVQLMFRAGELCGDQRDARSAEQRFARILELDPEHAPAMTALAAIYRQSGEYLRAAKLFVEAVPHTANRLQRTRLYAGAAEMYERVDDAERAVILYQQVLADDPEHLPAAERLAELLWTLRRHAELVPVLELLSLKPQARNVAVERQVRLGRACEELGLNDKAEKAWARAAELDPTSYEAQRKRADHHLRRGEHAEALQALDRVFQHHIDRLPISEHVELFSQMGRCELMLGAREAARELLARALELDPAHRPSLLAHLQLVEEPTAQLEARRALLRSASPEEQIRLLGEIGDLYHQRLEEPARAIASWREALSLGPPTLEERRLLHKCLDALTVERAWPEALEMLERLIAVERDAQVRARYRLTAALVCRDELERGEEALQQLRAALDDDGDLERAWAALEQIYFGGEEWKELARLYRAKLKRLSAESPGDSDGKNGERLRVWSALGDVCWDRLGEREAALAAHEVALGLDAGNLDRWRRLADLYVQAGPPWFEKSVAVHQHVLARDKQRVPSYRALKHLYIQVGQREKSIACSYALELLHKSEPDDAHKIAAYKRRPMQPARRPLPADAWLRLGHPDEDRLLGALFARVAPVLAAGVAQPRKSLGVNPKEALTADDPRSYVKALKYVAATFEVPVPEAYALPEQREAARLVMATDGKTVTPVVLLGAPLVGERRRDVEQVFELARLFALARPERLPRLIAANPTALAQVMEAAMALGEEGASEPVATDAVGRVLAALKHALPPQLLAEVATLGQKLRASGPQPEAAALAWLQAADLTGLRAGWLLSGDLETAARAAAADGAVPFALPPTQRLLELIWSSTTEELFAVRKQLGLL